MSGADAMFTLWQRVLGDALYLARRRRADRELAAAFPALTPDERSAIARRSARLQARLRRERFAERDAVRLCRDLVLDGAEALQRLREHPPETVAVFTARLGAPDLAARAVRLYGGDGERRVHLLPPGDGAAERVVLLGREVAWAVPWLGTPPAALFPVFSLLEARRQARVVFEPPLVVGEPAAAARAALGAIEAAVRARPEAWPWGAPAR